MEVLLIVVENLKVKRKKLLAEKEKNDEKIRECESKISYYKFLYSYFIWMKKAKEKNVQTYSKILDFSIEHRTLFDFLDNPSSNYAEKQMSKCKQDINYYTGLCLTLLKALKSYLKNLKKLKTRNNDIESKIAEIDLELLRLQEEKTESAQNENAPKKYILERGENDDWY